MNIVLVYCHALVESGLRHERKLRVTWGKAVAFVGNAGVLHLQIAIHNYNCNMAEKGTIIEILIPTCESRVTPAPGTIR